MDFSSPDHPDFDPDDPLGLTRPPTQEDLEWREKILEVDRACAELYSSSPLYQARAAKDPSYWKTFSVGGISMPQKAEKHSDECVTGPDFVGRFGH